jgi:hypothetical protein
MNKQPVLMGVTFVALILTLIISAFSNQALSASDQSTNALVQPTVAFTGSGVMVGIQAASGGPYWRTYMLPPGEPFHGRYRLLNQQAATNYVLTCLLDYRQQPCIWDRQSELLYEVELDRAEQTIIPFTTPPLTSTFHDFAILAIANAGVEDLSEEYRIRTDSNYLYAYRSVFLSGAEPWTPPHIDEMLLGTERSSRVSFEGVIVNQDEHPVELRAWTVYEAAPGETIDYYIHIGNGSDDNPPNTFAIMAFLDYGQIPLDGEEQWVAFARMPSGSATTLPAQVTAPEQPGIYELMIVYAYNPYTMLEEPPFGEERSLTRPPAYIFSSIRTAIVVEESNSP